MREPSNKRVELKSPRFFCILMLICVWDLAGKN